MKRLLIYSALFLSLSCSKKESFDVYKIESVRRPGTFACEFTATCPGKPEVKFWAECEKYKVGQTIKIQL